MSASGPTIDLSRGAAYACGLGIAYGLTMPVVLPGVLLVCAMLQMFEP